MYMMKITFCIIFITIFGSVIHAENNNPIFYKDSDTAEKFSITALDPQDFSTLELKGKPVNAQSWKDLNGKNLLFLTQTGIIQGKTDTCQSAELYLYHYIHEGGQFSLIRKIYDVVKDCQFDIYAGFLGSSLTITDLDNDNFAEITILYKLTCRSDVTPASMKLIMIENGDKYALRGSMLNAYIKHLSDTERMKEIKEYGWGKYTVDKSFKKAPIVFLEFSKKRWELFKDKDEFTQMIVN